MSIAEKQRLPDKIYLQEVASLQIATKDKPHLKLVYKNNKLVSYVIQIPETPKQREIIAKILPGNRCGNELLWGQGQSQLP